MARQMRRVSVTPVLDTSAFATGDQVGAALLVFNEILDASGMGSELALVTVLDKDKQSAALDLFIFDRPVTLAGAENAAANVSDADMEFCLGVVNVLAADYDTLSASSIATLAFRMPLVNNGSGRADQGQPVIPKHRLYVQIVSRGAPTYAAGSLVISLTTTTVND